MTVQPLIDAPRACAGDEVVTVTLSGLTLSDVVFAAPANRPGPIQLRRALLAQYAAAGAAVQEAMLQEMAERMARLQTLPAPADVDPRSFVDQLDRDIEELHAHTYDAEALERAHEVGATVEGTAQGRCVRVTVGPQGDLRDIAFGPTAPQAQDLGRQVVETYRRAQADVREAVAQIDPTLITYVCPAQEENHG